MTTAAPESFQQHDFDTHMRIALEHAVYDAKNEERELLQRALNGEGGEAHEPLTKELANSINNDFDVLPEGLRGIFRVFFAARHQRVTSHQNVIDSLVSQAENGQITRDEFAQRVKASNEEFVESLSYDYPRLHADIHRWFQVHSFPMPENYEEAPGGLADAILEITKKIVGTVLKGIGIIIKGVGIAVRVVGIVISAIGDALRAAGKFLQNVGDFLSNLF